MKEADKSNRSPSSLWQQLLQEYDAMTNYALASGLDVPGSIVQTVEKQLIVMDHPDADIKNLA